MDSVHSDERNLAHSANDRNLPKKVADDQQILKLKEEHQKEIEKLRMEFKIQQLESENENKMKIMQLEKDNQTLSHQLEIIKLKGCLEVQSSQIRADGELQNKMIQMQEQLSAKDKEIADTKNGMTIKLNEIEKDIAAKENECKMQLMEKGQEMLAKENDLKIQMKDLENANKLKLAELTKEKEKVIQSLRNEIEKMKLNNSQTEEVVQSEKAASVKIEKPLRVFTKDEKLCWGADSFFGGTEWLTNVYESYEDWYEGISLLLPDRKQEDITIDGKKYVVIKKNFNRCHADLYIGFKKQVRKVSPEYWLENCDVMVEGLSKEAINIGKFFLLHPKLLERRLQFQPHFGDRWWKAKKIPEDFYFADENSAIILVVSK